ncbi:MAG TPA: hypothetical protein VK718_12025 [Ferruginibacter sp.]|jgi:hypothetical protein|nr:hypothetical protein [Ferruginibacter sp.]
MENPKSDIESLFEKSADYIETRIDLLKLHAVDKIADIVSSLVCMLLIAIVVSMVFFILNIGIALWIGHLLGKTYYGFFIVAGFYSICSLILYLFRNKVLKTGISNLIIKKLLH